MAHCTKSVLCRFVELKKPVLVAVDPIVAETSDDSGTVVTVSSPDRLVEVSVEEKLCKEVASNRSSIEYDLEDGRAPDPSLKSNEPDPNEHTKVTKPDKPKATMVLPTIRGLKPHHGSGETTESESDPSKVIASLKLIELAITPSDTLTVETVKDFDPLKKRTPGTVTTSKKGSYSN